MAPGNHTGNGAGHVVVRPAIDAISAITRSTSSIVLSKCGEIRSRPAAVVDENARLRCGRGRVGTRRASMKIVDRLYNRASETRRLAGMGRVRAVLRLGERADARPPRRGVLAARRRQVPTVRCSNSDAAPAASRAAGACRRRAWSAIDRSAPMLDRARRQILRSQILKSSNPSSPRPRRHPASSV